MKPKKRKKYSLQTRQRLCAMIMDWREKGWDSPKMVEELNRQKFTRPNGGAWDTHNFTSAICRLRNAGYLKIPRQKRIYRIKKPRTNGNWAKTQGRPSGNRFVLDVLTDPQIGDKKCRQVLMAYFQ